MTRGCGLVQREASAWHSERLRPGTTGGFGLAQREVTAGHNEPSAGCGLSLAGAIGRVGPHGLVNFGMPARLKGRAKKKKRTIKVTINKE